MRDVHYTHYGRMCPIETPEGPNIGLIASSGHARAHQQLRLHRDAVPPGREGPGARDKIEYLTADQEDAVTIAQANAAAGRQGPFRSASACWRGSRASTRWPSRTKLDYMDVSPKQIVSAAASLIPFLEHDDANRALMGCNMQRQAVPLLRTEAPIVGTGMEKKIAIDSGAVVVAEAAAWSSAVDRRRDRRHVRRRRDQVRSAQLLRRQAAWSSTSCASSGASNQDTCYNQKPLVRAGRPREGRATCSPTGRAPSDGELALGRNLLVAFMPWGGYNFEDAILVSERCVTEDIFTSLHIEEFELQVRDTKRGVEEVTREIPNVGEEALKNLDEDGVICHRRARCGRRHPGRQGHAQGRDRAHARRRNCCGPSSARRPAT